MKISVKAINTEINILSCGFFEIPNSLGHLSDWTYQRENNKILNPNILHVALLNNSKPFCGHSQELILLIRPLCYVSDFELN